METISEMLDVDYPIIMGALGSLGNPELVAAVSEGGGFGLLGTAAHGRIKETYFFLSGLSMDVSTRFRVHCAHINQNHTFARTLQNTIGSQINLVYNRGIG